VRRVLVTHGLLQRVGLRFGREAKVLLDELVDALRESFDALAGFERGGRAADGSRKRAVVVLHADRRRALAPLDDHLRLPVLQLLRLQDARNP
jgi:hypothetical protein